MRVQKSKERALEKSDKIARLIRNAGGLPCTAPKLTHRPLDAKMFKKIENHFFRVANKKLSTVGDFGCIRFPKRMQFSFHAYENQRFNPKGKYAKY